jgi:hypothetical protein
LSLPRVESFKEVKAIAGTMEKFLNDVEAAKFLSVSPQTLRNWRFLGKGPEYYKRGRMVRYSLSDLIAWMDEGRIDHKVGSN